MNPPEVVEILIYMIQITTFVFFYSQSYIFLKTFEIWLFSFHSFRCLNQPLINKDTQTTHVIQAQLFKSPRTSLFAGFESFCLKFDIESGYLRLSRWKFCNVVFFLVFAKKPNVKKVIYIVNTSRFDKSSGKHSDSDKPFPSTSSDSVTVFPDINRTYITISHWLKVSCKRIPTASENKSITSSNVGVNVL